MRYVVTGGAGFLGSHICERLLKEGHFVVCIDNLSSGKKNNVAEFMHNKSFEFLQADISNPVQVEGHVDGIFHFASLASPPRYQARPIGTMMANSMGTYHLMNLAKSKGAKFLFASTSEAYGDPLVHPQKETYWGNVNPVGVRSCYDESKRFGEAIIVSYNREFNTRYKIIRIFNTYGPRMDMFDGRVVPQFMREAIKGEPITVYGDGRQTRSFCYVDDLVEGIIRMMNRNELGPINLGNPQERTIIDFAHVIKKMLNSKSEIVFEPLPKDDPMQRCPDISLAKARLGWAPKVSFEDGMKRTADWFRQEIEKSKSK